MRSVSVLGATGSVGESAFDLLMRAGGPATYRTVALTGGANIATGRDGAVAAAEIAVTAWPEKLAELRAALAVNRIEAASRAQAVTADARPSRRLDAVGHRRRSRVATGLAVLRTGAAGAGQQGNAWSPPVRWSWPGRGRMAPPSCRSIPNILRFSIA